MGCNPGARDYCIKSLAIHTIQLPLSVYKLRVMDTVLFGIPYCLSSLDHNNGWCMQSKAFRKSVKIDHHWSMPCRYFLNVCFGEGLNIWHVHGLPGLELACSCRICASTLSLSLFSTIHPNTLPGTDNSVRLTDSTARPLHGIDDRQPHAFSCIAQYETVTEDHSDASGLIFCLLFRPPVRSNGRSYKMLVMFILSFFSPTVLRVPSTDRPETLPPDRNLRVFYNASPKIRGGGTPQKKFGGQKHAKFRSILDHFRLWSRISPERLKASKIGRRYKLWQLLLRLMKKVRWTLVH